jgi:protein phosphatase 2C family protein 2/3
LLLVKMLSLNCKKPVALKATEGSYRRAVPLLNTEDMASPRHTATATTTRHRPASGSLAEADVKGHGRSLTSRNSERRFFSEPVLEPSKKSLKVHGLVRAYAANTHPGIVRPYNEDRVSIILNILNPSPSSHEPWPRCSFFGVYDGHGGSGCSDFLRDNLHQFILKDPSFPHNPKEALFRGFRAAELAFAKNSVAKSGDQLKDKSGSCAIVVLLVEDICYVANVGDSRAVMSGSLGSRTIPLSKDHKPDEEGEAKRIVEAGGKIYQSQAMIRSPQGVPEQVLGPHRVSPGRLSVSPS